MNKKGPIDKNDKQMVPGDLLILDGGDDFHIFLFATSTNCYFYSLSMAESHKDHRRWQVGNNQENMHRFEVLDNILSNEFLNKLFKTKADSIKDGREKVMEFK